MWLCPEQASISLMVLFLTGCVTVGDTMNTASRMESTCRLGCVHVSDVFGNLLPHEDWESTGGVEVGTVVDARAFMHRGKGRARGVGDGVGLVTWLLLHGCQRVSA